MMTVNEHLSAVTKAESMIELLVNAGAPGYVIQSQIDKARAAKNYAEFSLKPEQYEEFKHKLGLK